MNVTVIGLNHRTAPLAVRERLAIPTEGLPPALRHLCAAGLEEAVILSTCNRTELYTSSPADLRSFLIEFLSRRSGLPAETLAPLLYIYEGREALAHLLRVAAGLDSVILGESEVTAQVKQAYQVAHANGSTGPILNRAFQRALHAAKLMRRTTRLGSGQASVGSIVAAMARQIFGPRLAHCEVLLWGAGKAGEISARHLMKVGVQRLWIVNRTQTKAQDLADVCRARWLSWEEAIGHLAHVDIAIVCTQAPHYVIDAHDVAAVQARRSRRPLFLLDLAVPRNIDPAVAGQGGVSLSNIDDLQAVAQAALADRRQAVSACEAILEAQVARFWRASIPGCAPTSSARFLQHEEVEAWCAAAV